MIPKPPGSDSACRAGNGFQISKTRKSIKPSSKYFQLTANVRGVASPRYEINCPATSSTTTTCGSFVCKYFAVRSAAQTPITETMMTIADSFQAKFVHHKAGGLERSPVAAIRGATCKRLRAMAPQPRTAPAREPQVPGAFGR